MNPREFFDDNGFTRRCDTCANFKPTKNDPNGALQGECRAAPPTTAMFILQPPPQPQSSLMIGGKQTILNGQQPPMQIQTTFYPLVNGADDGCGKHAIIDVVH